MTSMTALIAASYFCTWYSQGQVGAPSCREGMHEKYVFEDPCFASYYKDSRKDLYFVYDDGWDVPVGVDPSKDRVKFGAMYPHPTRFPSIRETEPAARLKALVERTMSYGWKGVGLWVCIQSQAELGAPEWKGKTAEEEWREKIRWCHEAGVRYLKVDWGNNCGDVAFRRMLSRLVREIAPEILVEHAVCQPPVNGFDVKTKTGSGRRLDSVEDRWLLGLERQIMPFSDRWRIYDWYDPLVVPQCVDRTLQDLKIAEETGSKAIVSTEDCVYLGAVLGCEFGIMRGENQGVWWEGTVQSIRRRTTEVARAVAWARIAPPFGPTKGYEVRWGAKVNTDSHRCTKENFWYEPVRGIDLAQSAPAVSARGMALPVVKGGADGETDYVTCCRNPNGAVAVLAMPRSNGTDWTNRLTEVEIDYTAGEKDLLGVFGWMKSLTVRCPADARILVRDLNGQKPEVDLTESCRFADGRVTIDGAALGRAGTDYDTTSLPGVVVRASRLAGLVREDLRTPVYPGGVEGREFWNENAEWFMYPPAFDFSEVKGAVRYRFLVTDDRAFPREFFADSPKASLAPVWPEVPVGLFTVICEGVDAATNSLGLARRKQWSGDRPEVRGWKSAPFRPGTYPPAARSYAEAAAKVYDYVFEKPSLRYFLEKGEPDPSYRLNCYPTKMHAALVSAMVNYAKARPERAAEALKLARNAADYLIGISEPAGAPLEYFPPTYETKPELIFATASTYAGQNMNLYPANAGNAYLALAAATGEGKYREAALRIADTYVKLQGEDGTWYLKQYLKDGRPVAPNRAFPAGIGDFLEKASAASGNRSYHAAAERAVKFIEAGPMKSYNWEGQFEDVKPTPKYRNLTKHPAGEAVMTILETFPKDARRLADCREVVRFCEDQFVCWERPCRADGTGVRTALSWAKGTCARYSGWLMFPSAVEQYHWYVPIDASNAKMIRVYLALYRASGDPLALAKARALGDSLTRAQFPSGRIPTHFNDENWNNSGLDWLNCMLAAANALVELAAVAP